MSMVKRVSIIIPVYNEVKLLRKIFDRVIGAGVCGLEKEVIIIDDGSTDGTRRILKELEKECFQGKIENLFDFKVLYEKKNGGKGTALRHGFKLATGGIIMTQDADLEYNPKDYGKLLRPILNDGAEVVYGSRFLGEKLKNGSKPTLSGKNKLAYWSFYLGGSLVTLMTNLLYNAKITDEATGYKVFLKEILNGVELKAKGFEFCPEITAKIRKMKKNIVEVPIYYKPRTFEQGKKIKWKDGVIAIWTLIKYRFIN